MKSSGELQVHVSAILLTVTSFPGVSKDLKALTPQVLCRDPGHLSQTTTKLSQNECSEETITVHRESGIGCL